MNKRKFQETVWTYYFQNKRDFPWRKTVDPYRIYISEIMLQQTQAQRVVAKYEAFVKRFPSFALLARAKTSSVLTLWSGLGYNRRALNLQRVAKLVVAEYGGVLPKQVSELTKLPGIGPYTAGAIAAFAFNQPGVFLETNIRRVYIHHFFKKDKGVTDKQLLPIIEKTLPEPNKSVCFIHGREISTPAVYREWYWALMDYGAHLASVTENANRRSTHYAKQSKFKGSFRQLRGAVVKLLVSYGAMSYKNIGNAVADIRLPEVLKQLQKEGFVAEKNSVYSLT